MMVLKEFINPLPRRMKAPYPGTDGGCKPNAEMTEDSQAEDRHGLAPEKADTPHAVHRHLGESCEGGVHLVQLVALLAMIASILVVAAAMMLVPLETLLTGTG
jgi:hypothetical protein